LSLPPELQRIVVDLRQLEAIVPPAKMAELVTMMHNLLLSAEEWPRRCCSAIYSGPEIVGASAQRYPRIAHRACRAVLRARSDENSPISAVFVQDRTKTQPKVA